MSKKRLKGKVVSNKMMKTVVVSVDSKKRHPVYEKVVKVTKKFKARDDLQVNIGDTVVIEETKPFSKDVSWKVVEKVEK